MCGLATVEVIVSLINVKAVERGLDSSLSCVPFQDSAVCLPWTVTWTPRRYREGRSVGKLTERSRRTNTSVRM